MVDTGIQHGATLVGDSLVYLMGAGLIGIGNSVLLPLYTRCLSASQFGTYALLDVTVLLVVRSRNWASGSAI